MSFSVAAKNLMLDALSPTTMSLHTDFPGTTGANEVTGGAPAYARKASAFGAAASGIRSLSAAVTFDVPACTVRWVCYWNGATLLGVSPNQSAPQEFLADATTDAITAPSHGYVTGTKVVFYNGTPPGGLTEGVVYYVVNPTTNTFQVAASSGGAAINLTSSGASDVQVSSITEQVYAAQGTHSITATTFAMPF